MNQPRLTPIAAAVRAVVQQWVQEAAYLRHVKEQEAREREETTKY